MPPPQNPPRTSRTNQELSLLQSFGAGAAAGTLGPLSNSAVSAFNGSSDVTLASIPWVQVLLFAVIGGIVSAFMSDGMKKHVFSYGIAAPFLVLNFINNKQAADSDKKAASVTQAVSAVKTTTQNNQAATVENSPPPLGAEAEQATIASDLPAL